MRGVLKYRYLIFRRLIQFSVIILFAGGNYFGWSVLKGNLSSGLLLGEVKLSDPFAVLQILVTGFWVGTDVLVSALIVLVLYTIISGRVFCSWICPVNPISDLARWLHGKIWGKNKERILNRNARYAVLVLTLILSAVTGIAAFEAISPIAFLHREIIFGAGAGWTVILMIVLLDLGWVKNGWCGHLCPLGAFYGLAGHAGLVKVRHIKNKCTNCNECFRVCPEVQVLDIVGKKDGFIKSGECTNCSRCIEVCADDALKYSVRLLKRKYSKN